MKKIILILLLFSDSLYSQNLEFLTPYNDIIANWTYHKEIIVDNRGNLSDLNDQVKINLTPSNFDFSQAMSAGEDIRFTFGSVGDVLPYWIESYDNINQIATIWVKVSGIQAGSNGVIYIHYGRTGQTTTSSFVNTMTRLQTSEPNSTYVVRFGDGSGTTPANIGSAGGAMAIVGGSTWNTNDIWGGTAGSLTLNGTTGYVQKTGLLDTWSTTGSIHINFKLSSLSGDPTILSKQNRISGGGSDDGDYVRLYVRSSDSKLILNLFIGASQKLVVVGTTTMLADTRYNVSLCWNTKVNAQLGGYMLVFLRKDGDIVSREISTYNVVSYPPTGSAAPFRIGAMSNITTSAAENFAALTVNDFSLQTEQVFYSKIQAIQENRNYYQKDEQSKWDISKTPDDGAAATNVPVEPSITFYEAGVFVEYIAIYNQNGIPVSHAVWRRTTPSITPNVTTTWSNFAKVIGDGSGSISVGVGVSNCVVRKFGSTYYAYYRTAAGGGNGPILCVTSSDGITFSSSVTVLPNQGSGWGDQGYYNTDVIFDARDGYYYMLAEAKSSTLVYAIGVARCKTPDGTFVPFGTNPKSSMLPGSGVGNLGGPTINLVDGVFHVWFHCDPNAGTLPMEMYRAYTTNWNDWTKYGGANNPVVIRERSQEYDQSSDGTVFEQGGNSYIVYNGMENNFTSQFAGYTNIGKFSAPLSKLVIDCLPTLTNPINVPTVAAFKTRVLADAGTFEYQTQMETHLTTLLNYNEVKRSNILLTPNGYKTNKLYAIKTVDGTSDLATVRATTAFRTKSDLTVESVSSGVPRIDNLNSTPEILLEPSNTNLIIRSQEIDNASWSKSTTSVTANVATSPDGTSTADRVTGDGTNNPKRTFQTGPVVTLNSYYTVSAYVKYESHQYIQIWFGTGQFAATNIIIFDIVNGTIGSQVNWTDGSITRLANGWWYVTATQQASAASGTTALSFTMVNASNSAINAASTTTGSFLIWQVDCQTGRGRPTSSIPTTTTSVTRNADEVTALTSVSGKIGQTEGTILLTIRPNANFTSKFFSISDGTANNRISLELTATNTLNYTVVSGGVSQASISTSALVTNTPYKIAIVYSNNYAALFVNGVKTGQDLSVTVPACSKFAFDDGTGSSPFYGRVSLCAVDPGAKSDVDCLLLTQ